MGTELVPLFEFRNERRHYILDIIKHQCPVYQYEKVTQFFSVLILALFLLDFHVVLYRLPKNGVGHFAFFQNLWIFPLSLHLGDALWPLLNYVFFLENRVELFSIMNVMRDIKLSFFTHLIQYLSGVDWVFDWSCHRKHSC